MSEPKYQITPLGFLGEEMADKLELYCRRMDYNAIVLVAPSKFSWEKVEYRPFKEAKKAKYGDNAPIKRHK